MQSKEIPDRPIIEMLARLERGEIASTYSNPDGTVTTWYPTMGVVWPGVAHSVAHAMPAGLKDKQVRAKMRMLIRRGLSTGCTCGCRGDFAITSKGLSLLNVPAQPRDL